MKNEYWICKGCGSKKTSPLGTYCFNCGETFERFVNADEVERSYDEAIDSLTKECHRLDAQTKELEAGKSEWISVDDRLPEFDEKVLTCTERGIRKISFISDRYGPTEWDCFSGVTAWQPLPPPPQENNK